MKRSLRSSGFTWDGFVDMKTGTRACRVAGAFGFDSDGVFMVFSIWILPPLLLLLTHFSSMVFLVV